MESKYETMDFSERARFDDALEAMMVRVAYQYFDRPGEWIEINSFTHSPPFRRAYDARSLGHRRLVTLDEIETTLREDLARLA
jgi:hypothetical protein